MGTQIGQHCTQLAVAVSFVAGSVATAVDGLLSPTCPQMAVLDQALPSHEARDVALAGTTLCVANGDDGVLIYDVTNAGDIVEIGSVDTPFTAFEVFIEGTRLFVADAQGGLIVIDITQPSLPAVLGVYDDINVSDVVTRDGIAYISGFVGPQNGIWTLDISNPSKIVELGFCPLASPTNLLYLHGPLVYVANVESGVGIVDVSDPMDLVYIDNVPTTGRARQIDVHENVMFVICGDAGLDLFNVSNAVLPVFLSHTPFDLLPTSVDVVGRFAYLTEYESGRLYALDVGDSTEPSIVNSIQFIGRHESLAIRENIAYVASNTQGVHNVDLNLLRCPGDRNSTCSLDFFDISDFLNNYSLTNGSADLAAPVGIFNFFDVAAYLKLFNEGCSPTH